MADMACPNLTAPPLSFAEHLEQLRGAAGLYLGGDDLGWSPADPLAEARSGADRVAGR